MNAMGTPSLAARLQEKLDAIVQSPQAFSISVSIDKVNLVSDSGDESSIQRSVSPPKFETDYETISAKHGYRDFSRVAAEKADSPTSSLAKSATAKEPTFPAKLHMILTNPEFQDIVSWLPHGRSWRILQQKAFEEKVIPLYFRHGRYSSFARQVNGWGFRRVTHGSDYNSYYHEMFLRGMPHLCEQMRRLTNKDTVAKKKKVEDEPAPDFYSMSRTFPLPETLLSPVPTSCTVNATPFSISGRTAAPPPFDFMDNSFLDRRRADILLAHSGLNTGALTLAGMNSNSASHHAFLRSGLMGFGGSGSVPAPSPSAAFQQLLLQSRCAGNHRSVAQLLVMNQEFGLQGFGLPGFGLQGYGL